MKSKRLIRIVLILVLALGLTAICTVSAGAAAGTPSKVTGVRAAAASDTIITVSWQKAKNAGKYEIQYKKTGAKKYRTYTTVSSKTKKVKVKKLKANTRYSFRVRAVSGKKKGKFSKAKTAKTYPKPADITGLFIRKRDKSQIVLKWDETAHATYFEVKEKEIHTGRCGVYPGDTMKTDEGTFEQLYQYTTRTRLTPNAWYEFRIRGVYSKGKNTDPVYGSWSGPYYVCALSGDRVIIGERWGDPGEYAMNDTFVIGYDDPLVPQGVYSIHHPTDSDDENDGYENGSYQSKNYENDSMYVPAVSFPDDFTDPDTGVFMKDLSSSFDEELDGRTLHAKDPFDGSTIDAIYIEPHMDDRGATGHSAVIILTNDARYIKIIWR